MSLILTRTQDIRSGSNLDKNEIRQSRWGALAAAVRDNDRPDSIITPELRAKARNSIHSTIETPVIDYDGTITISNTRSATVSDSELTSGMQGFNFTTYAWGFTQVPVLFDNNEIGMQKDWNKKFFLYLHKFLSTLDTSVLTSLNTNKTQAWGDYLTYTDPTTTSDIVEVPAADKERVLGDMSVMMEANDYFGELRIIGNGGLQAIINQLAEHGTYNDQMKRLQFQDKILHYTTRLSNAANKQATFYAVEAGSLGLLTRVDREALRGSESKYQGYMWDTIREPYYNLEIGVMRYESVGDYSAIAGAASADMKAVRKEHWGFSVDVAPVTPYNSDITTLANPIMKAHIAAS